MLEGLHMSKRKYATKEELKQVQIQNGYNHKDNLIKWDNMDKEELKAIKQKGQKATMDIVRSKKNIKSICNELLNMSASDIASNVVSKEMADKLKDTDITLYDLIIAKQIEVALKDGSVRSAEFLRDSNGDKPTDKTQTDINIISESDKLLLNSINERLEVVEGLHNNTIVDIEPKKPTE